MAERLIRSVFDQYSHLENRLTHALIRVLAADQQLTRELVGFTTGQVLPKRDGISLTCQLVPGERPQFVDEERIAEQRGIPDAWIYSGDWALVIEAKVESALTRGQLRRHLSTARKSFERANLLAITADERAPNWLHEEPHMSWSSWAKVYTFVSSSSRYSNPVSRYLGQQFMQYIRAVEARREAGDKILSTFTGIPFDADNPFSDDKARVLLRSLTRELRPRLARSHVLPSLWLDYPQKPLTGTWDVIAFQFSKGDPFTKHPHLSVGIWDEGTSIELILPNAAKRAYWKRLARAAAGDGLGECLSQVLRRALPLSREIEAKLFEPRIVFEIIQRHFHARRREVLDGRIRFDLAALAGESAGPVKALPGWMPATRDILVDARNVNLQLQLTALYPSLDKRVSRNPGLVEELVSAAEAMKPFLDLLRGES